MESLEQLRVLWNGYRIYCVESEVEIPVGVDTQDDLDRVRKIFEDLKKN
jgi:3-deoxy-manno-octulosonate cytidylyltransferase (CMP-KDO synthetase)